MKKYIFYFAFICSMSILSSEGLSEQSPAVIAKQFVVFLKQDYRSMPYNKAAIVNPEKEQALFYGAGFYFTNNCTEDAFKTMPAIARFLHEFKSLQNEFECRLSQDVVLIVQRMSFGGLIGTFYDNDIKNAKSIGQLTLEVD